MTTSPKRKRFRLTNIQMRELSGVDWPAQEPALTALTKRKPIVEVGKTDDTNDRDDQEKQTMDAEKKALEDQIAKLSGELKKSQDDLATVTKQRDAAESAISNLVVMDADQASFAKSMTVAAIVEFANRGEAERTAHIEKTRGPVVYEWKSQGGRKLYRSDGEATIALAKRDDIREAEMADIRKERDEVVISKRAEEEMGHFGGEDSAKIALLRAVDGISDADVKKSVLALIEETDAQCAELFGRRGAPVPAGSVDIGKGGSPAAKLDELAKVHAKEIAKARRMSEDEAFELGYAAALESAEGRKLYNQLGSYDV